MMLLRADLRCFQCPNVARENSPICTFAQEGDQNYLVWMTEFHGDRVPIFTEREAEALIMRENWRVVPATCFMTQREIHQVINDIFMSDICCIEVPYVHPACEIYPYSRGDRQDIRDRRDVPREISFEGEC